MLNRFSLVVSMDNSVSERICGHCVWTGFVPGLFDLRKGLHPVDQSMTEFTHRHAIRDARWLQSKTGTEFFSVAADGMVYWWDTKKMNEPVDRLLLDLERKGRKEHASPITTSDYDSSLVRHRTSSREREFFFRLAFEIPPWDGNGSDCSMFTQRTK